MILNIERGIAVFILLGLIALLADFTYEGARGVLGAYIAVLGGTSIAVGLFGLGEFLGYISRFLGGYIAHLYRSSKVVWGLVACGYTVNLVAVPLLALAGDWITALILVILERIGKGLRAPARDVILAEVSESFGRGKGFGIHELLDQIGAIAGPLAVGWSIAVYGSYTTSFTLLAIPAFTAIVLVSVSFTLYPSLRSLHQDQSYRGGLHLYRYSRSFKLYLAFVFFMVAGFIHWGLISFHAKSGVAVSDSEIGFAYSLAMAVDAATAVLAGYLYDRVGLKALAPIPAAAVATAVALAHPGWGSIYMASLFWGVAMGMIETVVRASIPELVEPSERALAYGSLGLVQGIAYMLGGFAVGYLYSIGIAWIATYIIVIEAIAASILIYLLEQSP